MANKKQKLSTEESHIEIALKALEKREKVRSNLYDWCEHALAPMGQAPARHHKILIDALTDVANGDCDRLMINLPPGSAKSTYASVLFPAWFMAQAHHKNVVLASYGAFLAENFSRQCRNTILENASVLGVTIPSGSNSVERWATTNGSKFLAVGAGSGVTGFRADLIIIDDPVKGRESADSPASRDSLWRWYCSDLFTRLKPGGRIVYIGTRWHEDDLAGRLIQDQGEEWRVINLPALCDDPENDLLDRELGEPLWPEWQSLENLLRTRKTVGEREWSALYQQQPVLDGGALINVSKLNIEKVEPSYLKSQVVRAWDIAATSTLNARNPDFTVGLLLARDANGRYIVLDIVKVQGEPATVEKLITDTAIRDGTGVSISVPQDPGASGKSYVQYLIRQLAGYDIHSSRESGSKVGRATPMIAQMNAGNVSLFNATWNRSFIEECECFPSGMRDDQIDAASRAFNYLVEKNRRPTTFVRMNIMGR
jgi:predicted phage terminase large subunit-like protein